MICLFLMYGMPYCVCLHQFGIRITRTVIIIDYDDREDLCMKCPNCGAENSAEAKYCEACGTKLVSENSAVNIPEVTIPVPPRPEQKPKIELVLPGHEMYEQEEEPDLSDILSPHNGVETHGNMQAATLPKIELVIPEETDLQKKAKADLDRELEERRREREEGKKPLTYREEYGSLQKEEAKPEPEWKKAAEPKYEERRETAAPKTDYRKETYSSSSSMFDEEMYPGDQTWGAIAYLWWIGFVFAWFRTKNMQSEFMRKHLNNAFYLHVLAILLNVFNLGFIGGILGFAVFAFAVMGLIAALRGEEQTIPVISDLPKIF